jgi:acetyltransferase-like isoleucine patch superfamily enzyme
MKKINEALTEVENIVSDGITTNGVIKILDMLRCSFPIEILEEMELYAEYLPQNKKGSYTNEKKYLHFLWDVLDKSPMCLIANFAIPFRRILAMKLFKSCGKNFIAEENVRFNVPDSIEVGDDVFINKGTFIDSKGGVKIGNFVGVGEGVNIFTHSHLEHEHSLRTYEKVIINDYAKIYANATILPGVIIDKQAIVAACTLVNKRVENNSLVAGIPAKKIRERNNLGKNFEELRHIWLDEGAYQE